MSRRSVTPKSAEAVAWMSEFFQRSAEKAPNSGNWYLPCHLTRYGIFAMYKQRIRNVYISKSQFCQLWLDFFKHVKIPNVIKQCLFL